MRYVSAPRALRAPSHLSAAEKYAPPRPRRPAALTVSMTARGSRLASALAEGIKNPHAVTHLGTGRGRVEGVASNRRILGPDGKVKHVRFSS